MTVLLTLDWRERDGVFGDSVKRTRLLMGRLETAGQSVQLVNINSPVAELRRTLEGKVVFVQADSPSPSAAVPPRYRVPHGFRLWLERNRFQFAGSRYSGVRRASTFSKPASRAALRRCGIAIPKGMLVGDAVEVVARRLGLPLVVKQAYDTGSGVAVHLVNSIEMLREVVEWHKRVRRCGALAEQFVTGREFTAWVIERKGIPRVYGIVEFSKPHGASLLDHGAKIRMRSVEAFTDEDRYWPEARFAPDIGRELRARLEDIAVRSHRACGLRHYSRIDVIAGENGPVVLDVNASPELDNWLEGAAARHGETVPEVVHHLLEEAAHA